MCRRAFSAFLGVVFTTLISHSAVADDLSAVPLEYPIESKALMAATLDLFERVETENAKQGRVPVIGIPLSVTQSRATAEAPETDVLTRMGPVDHLTGYRITWYPVETLYGTVDFMGTWNKNRNLVCGYLTWDLSDPDTPRLETVTASFVDLSALRDTSASQIHASLIEANCAFGAIDANYRFFDVTG